MIAIALAATAAGLSPVRVSVGDVLRDAKRYEGRVVSVCGVYSRGREPALMDKTSGKLVGLEVGLLPAMALQPPPEETCATGVVSPGCPQNPPPSSSICVGLQLYMKPAVKDPQR